MSLAITLERGLRDDDDASGQTYRGWKLTRDGDHITITGLPGERWFIIRVADALLLGEDLAAMADRNPAHTPRGQKGGAARAEALTPERRTEIARAAANARHHGVAK